jgi:ABC-type branched-subunit amino acid transport system ATPase component
MSDIVLDIKSLTRRFGAFTAVDGLSLSVTRIFWRISSLITH